MSAMFQNYNVYVSAIYSSFPRNDSTSAVSININLQVMTSYVSDVTVSMPKKHDSLESLIKSRSNVPKMIRDRSDPVPKSFIFNVESCRSLTGDFVSRVISDANIPFALDRIQWKGNPREDWTSLKNQDDLFQCILDIVTHSHDNEFTLVLIIHKKTILPHQEYEKMHYARCVLEEARDANRMVSFMNQEQANLGRPFLPSIWESSFYRPLRERGRKLGFDSYDSLIELALRLYAEQERFKLIPATKSSIQALEEVVIDDIESPTSCPICLENMEIGSPATCMPCSYSHKFHNPCIVLWLQISHVCPLCRLELPAE